MADKAPSKNWYAAKDDTPVKKYDTAGETLIDLPEGIEAVACDNSEDLAAIETDTSILTSNEKDELGIYE